MDLGSFNTNAQEVWDFVRCQRPDGSFYGTSGKCRQGTEVAAKLAKLPKEKLQKLAQHPKLTSDQKKQVNEALKGASTASVATKPPKVAEKTGDAKAKYDELIAKQKQLVKEGKLDEALKMSKEIGKATAELDKANKSAPKPAAKGKASNEDIAAQKKKVDELRKKIDDAKSSAEEDKAIAAYKKEFAKYQKMKGVNQGDAKKPKDEGNEANIAKLKKEGEKAKKEYEEAMKKGDWAKADAAMKKGMEVNKKLDEAQGVSKKLAEEAKEKRRKEEEADATQKKINDRQRAAVLTEKQKESIARYTGEESEFGYRQLNGCSRNPPTCPDPEEAKKFAKEFDRALAALPKNDDGDRFYRGIGIENSGPTAKLYESLEKATPGQRFRDPGYGSYSSDSRQAENFQYGTSGRSILFISRSKALTPINMFSEIPSEREAVLPRNIEQTIRNVRKEGDQLIVEVD